VTRTTLGAGSRDAEAPGVHEERRPERAAVRRGDAGALARAKARATDGAAEDMAAATARVLSTPLTAGVVATARPMQIASSLSQCRTIAHATIAKLARAGVLCKSRTTQRRRHSCRNEESQHERHCLGQIDFGSELAAGD
jgi:hypothetical protein